MRTWDEEIAQRLREAVAALPDTQGFLADAGIAFQCGDAQAGITGVGRIDL